MLYPKARPRMAKSFHARNMDRVCGLSLKGMVVTTEGLLLSPFIANRKEIRTIRTVKM